MLIWFVKYLIFRPVGTQAKDWEFRFTLNIFDLIYFFNEIDLL